MYLWQSFSPRLIDWYTKLAAQYSNNTNITTYGYMRWRYQSMYTVRLYLYNWYNFKAIYFFFTHIIQCICQNAYFCFINWYVLLGFTNWTQPNTNTSNEKEAGLTLPIAPFPDMLCLGIEERRWNPASYKSTFGICPQRFRPRGTSFLSTSVDTALGEASCWFYMRLFN